MRCAGKAKSEGVIGGVHMPVPPWKLGSVLAGPQRDRPSSCDAL